MSPFQLALHWLVIAAVFTVGYVSQWGPMARQVVWTQAEVEGRSPLHVVADAYMFFLFFTAPLMGLYCLMVSG